MYVCIYPSLPPSSLPPCLPPERGIWGREQNFAKKGKKTGAGSRSLPEKKIWDRKTTKEKNLGQGAEVPGVHHSRV
jgi:hypothetical protein